MASARLIAVAVATVALVASGCGKSSKSESTTTTNAAAQTTGSANATPVSTPSGKPLTRAQFIAAAEPSCTRLNAELHASPGDFRSATAINRVFSQAAAYERVEYNELSKLTPPASLASDWKLIMEGTRQWSEGSAAVAAYARANKVEAAKPIFKVTAAAHEKLALLAKRDGFKECGFV